MATSALSAPTADALVRIWERGQQQHVLDRALTILMAYCGASRRELAELPITQRDALLFECRRLAFDGPLHAYSSCPRCGCSLDVTVDPGHPAAEGATTGERSLSFRAPNSLDLAAIAGYEDVEEARRVLIERCVGAAAPDTIEAIEAELERQTVAIHLHCPDCGNAWTPILDIGAYLWEEIATFARRRLREVDILARRYGWSEQAILGLSAARRRFYLELA